MTPLVSQTIRKINSILGLSAQLNVESKISQISNFLPKVCDIDKTALFIGDNLNSLSALSVHSEQTVDLCYIDPPYNTGNKFIYNDSRKAENSGHFGTHGQWMSFLLPRVVLARELLKESGVIAISIDDYELPYLRILMDRVFGEQNFIGNIVVCRSKNGKGSKRNIAENHEYLVVYGKSSKSELIGARDSGNYDKSDRYGEFRLDGMFRKKGAASLRAERPNMYYPLYCDVTSGEVSVDEKVGWKEVFPVDSKGTERRWLWVKETARERQHQLYSGPSGTVYVKNYSCPEDMKRTKLRTMWSDKAFYTERATNELSKLFGDKIFDTPKPLEYMKYIIDSMCPEGGVVMDFFAGSGTTAHAVEELNDVTKPRRVTLLMEEAEPIPEKHAAYMAGFRQIADITQARLEKISNIKDDFSYDIYDLDTLVKSIELLESNKESA